MPFEAPLREITQFLVISMKITNFSRFPWNGGEFHENWWFRGFSAYLLRTIHNANEFQCFLGLRGSRICEFYDNSTILVIFMEITQNGVNSQKIGGILTFCSPGGLRTSRICNVFVWFGVGATRMAEKQNFQENPLILVEFHKSWWNGWIFMEKVVFCSFSSHLLPTLQNHCMFYRFLSPPGEQRVRIPLIFMKIADFHQF